MIEVWNWLSPLKTFIVGEAIAVILVAFFPSIGSAVTNTQSQVGSAVINSFWGLSWAMVSTKLILFGVCQGFILFGVAVTWLRRR